MKKIRQIIATVLAVMLMLCAAPQAWAASTAVSTNRSTATVGQTVTATVTFSGSMAAVQFSVNYSPSVLRYESYSSSADLTVNATSGVITAAAMTANGANASSIRCSFTFTAVAGGSSNVGVYVNDCIDEEGTPVTCSDGSATVTVNASSGTSVPPQSSQSSSAPEVKADPIEVTVNGTTKHIVRSLAGIEVPEEFETAEDEYAGEMIEVARGINLDILLMYLTDADGSNGGFYRYVRSENAFYPFYHMTVNASRYTVMDLPDQADEPEGWKRIAFEYGDQLIPGYKQEGVEQGLWLIYASNGKGDTGFYLYDPMEGTVQRYVQPTDLPASDSDGMIEKKGTFFERLLADRDIFVTVCVSWALIVLIAGAWLVTHLARKNAQVSDKKRKKKEEKVTKKLEKRAARAAKKSKTEAQPLEIGVLEEESSESEAVRPESADESADEPEMIEISFEEKSE